MGFLLLDKETGEARGWRRHFNSGDAAVNQVELADDHPDMIAFRLAGAKREKVREIEARARAINAARLPADLQTKADAAKVAIDGCTTEAELAELAEPDWPK